VVVLKRYEKGNAIKITHFYLSYFNSPYRAYYVGCNNKYPAAVNSIERSESS